MLGRGIAHDRTLAVDDNGLRAARSDIDAKKQ
jgi:hypothetical protein